jgi:hypothetical protein
VARIGSVTEAQEGNDSATPPLDDLSLFVSLSAFDANMHPKSQANINKRVKLDFQGFANLAATSFSTRARPKYGRLTFSLNHDALVFFTSDPPTTVRLGDVHDKLL